MKKTMILLAVVGVLAMMLGVVGFVYAQDDEPDTPFGWGFGHHGGRGGHGRGWFGKDEGDFGPMHEPMQAAIAEALGLTVEDLDAAYEEGKTPWDLAEEQGLSEDEFSTLIFDARQAGLEQAVADGTISQEMADWIQSHWDEMSEKGFSPGSCGRHGDQEDSDE